MPTPENRSVRRWAPWIGAVLSVGISLALVIGAPGRRVLDEQRLGVSDGPALTTVVALDVDAHGRVYVLERHRTAITVLDELGGPTRRIGHLRDPRALAAAADGSRVWVVDGGAVRVLDAAGRSVGRLAGGLEDPRAVAAAPDGAVDVLDGERVVRFGRDGRRRSVLDLRTLGVRDATAIATAETGTRYALADGGRRLVVLRGTGARTLAGGRFMPRALVAPPAAGVDVLDRRTGTVVHVGPDATPRPLAGVGPGPGTTAMTVDCRGTVLLAEPGRGDLRRIVDRRRDVLPCPLPAVGVPAGNLVRDPGAEEADMAVAEDRIRGPVVIPGWRLSGHAQAFEYAERGPFGPAGSGAFGGGLVHFDAYDRDATAEQVVRLPAHTPAGVRATLSAVFVGGGVAPPSVTATFLDRHGRQAGTIVLSADGRSVTALALARRTAALPPGSVTARVVIRISDLTDPGYVDNVALVLTPR